MSASVAFLHPTLMLPRPGPRRPGRRESQGGRKARGGAEMDKDQKASSGHEWAMLQMPQRGGTDSYHTDNSVAGGFEEHPHALDTAEGLTRLGGLK